MSEKVAPDTYQGKIMNTKKHFALLVFLSSFYVLAFSQQTCSSCGGYGKFRCNNCGGSGIVTGTVWNSYYGVYQQVSQPCGYCGGYGAIACSYCQGKGYVGSSNSSPSFKGTPSKTNKTVRIVCSTGADKGNYTVYIGANGAQYVYFAGAYRRINGNSSNSFSCNGNTYYAK